MQSLRELYRFGPGPSASHTMGPKRAAEIFIEKFPTAKNYKVTLFGSLAATGLGHMTDKAIKSVFSDLEIEILWKEDEQLPLHPNGMKFECEIDKNKFESWQVYSVGGGALLEDGETVKEQSMYKHQYLNDIMKYCEEEDLLYSEYVFDCEDENIKSYLVEVWQKMQESVERGLVAEGELPGGLNLKRKSKGYYEQAKLQGNIELQKTGMVSAFTLAVSEENACLGEVVTAPTCGACGVLPGVLSWFSKIQEYPDEMILKALATAGLIGNLAKNNASISGAEVGCQGEVGVACAMAAAAVGEILGASLQQIEYAAEMAIEHHLGLTCDPVGGLVQIPCIERNAIAASRAIECANYALLSNGEHEVSFDEVIETMSRTGRDLNSDYRETSKGGLAQTKGRNLCS